MAAHKKKTAWFEEKNFWLPDKKRVGPKKRPELSTWTRQAPMQGGERGTKTSEKRKKNQKNARNIR